MMARIETLSAYRCTFSYLQRNNPLKEELRRWTKGYTIKQPNMDCQPTEITALVRHRAFFS